MISVKETSFDAWQAQALDCHWGSRSHFTTKRVVHGSNTKNKYVDCTVL